MASFTKNAIRESFRRMISEKSIDKITVKDIAEDCGIARNTFYYHYQDIYEVLEDLLDSQVNRVVQQMRERDENKSVEEACREGFEDLRSHGDIFYQMYKSNSGEEVRRYFSKTATTLFDSLVDIKSEGIDASSEDKRLIAGFYRNAVSGFMEEWLESGMKFSIEDVFHRMELLFGDNITQALLRSQELKHQES